MPGLSAAHLRAIIEDHLQRLAIQDYQFDDLLTSQEFHQIVAEQNAAMKL